jgi:putative endonuclease
MVSTPATRRCDDCASRLYRAAVDGRRALGQRGEAMADAFVRALGWRVVARNFRCRAGEIDLVALDRDTVVFLEVRSRSGDGRGTPLESVDGRKQAQVVRVARHFLALHGWHERAARFDVVGVRFDAEPPAVEHVRGAFEVG